MATLEFRTGVELRAIAGRKLVGHVVKFGAVATIGGTGRSFRERVQPGAFTRTLAERRDVPALVDHDPSRLLARTASGSLRLQEDAHGLAFELDLPDTSLGRDMQVLAERHDLAGMSFGFHVAPGGEAWPADGLRELRAVELVEISIAQAWPAYPHTSIALRHRQPARCPEVSPAARRRLLDLI